MHEHSLQPLLGWYARLTPASLAEIDNFYAADAHFRDPFNDVCGVASIRAICEIKRRLWQIEGSTYLVFGVDGRVVEHRDYWDAAEQLYEKLPLIGGVLRLLKRSMR